MSRISKSRNENFPEFSAVGIGEGSRETAAYYAARSRADHESGSPVRAEGLSRPLYKYFNNK